MYIIPKPSHRPTPDEVRAYCAEHLVGYKVPTFVEFRSSLPRNMLGKVLRRVLAQEEKDRAAAPATGP